MSARKAFWLVFTSLALVWVLLASLLALILTSPLSQPQLVVYDGSWPMERAARTWRAQGEDIQVVTACPQKSFCIDVTERDYGPTRWVAKTYEYGAIHLNTNLSLDQEQRESVLCHELGHVLGVEHSPSSDSCMYFRLSRSVTP